jgi:hypothetical protein
VNCFTELATGSCAFGDREMKLADSTSGEGTWRQFGVAFSLDR